MSSNSFKYKARYGLERTVTKLDESTYTVEGPSLYARMAAFSEEEIQKNPSLADKISMFDFEGGPDLYVGSRLLDAFEDVIITEIKPNETIEGHCKVTLTVKKNTSNDSRRKN